MESTHLEDWLSHEHTQHFRERVKAELEPAAFQRLITACRASTDPAVRGAIAQYEAVKRLRDLFTKGSSDNGGV